MIHWPCIMPLAGDVERLARPHRALGDRLAAPAPPCRAGAPAPRPHPPRRASPRRAPRPRPPRRPRRRRRGCPCRSGSPTFSRSAAARRRMLCTATTPPATPPATPIATPTGPATIMPAISIAVARSCSRWSARASEPGRTRIDVLRERDGLARRRLELLGREADGERAAAVAAVVAEAVERLLDRIGVRRPGALVDVLGLGARDVDQPPHAAALAATSRPRRGWR